MRRGAGGGRQSRRPQGRGRAPLRRRRRVVTVPVAAQAGRPLLVRPGERVPADGMVISGRRDRRRLIVGGNHHRGVGASDDLRRRSELFGNADDARDRGWRRHPDRRVERAATGGRTRSPPLVDRAVARAERCATAALTAALAIAGASLHDPIITAIAVLIITCPCAGAGNPAVRSSPPGRCSVRASS